MDDRDLLRQRIEGAYLRHHPDATSSYGALAWFAATAGVSRRSVSRWFSDGDQQRSPSAPVLAVLELLEEAGD
jgi:hypothetical protein